MTKIEVAIRQILLAHEGVSGFVGERIYPHIMPQSEEYPALTYTVDETPDEVTTGPSGIIEADIEVTSWVRGSPSRSGYTGVRDLATAVRDALLGYRGEVADVYILSVTGGDVETGAPDETTEIWQAWTTVHVIARV